MTTILIEKIRLPVPFVTGNETINNFFKKVVKLKISYS